MKVAQHAKRQTARSKHALYAHATMARALIEAKRAADATVALQRMSARPMYYRLNPDHTTTPIYGRLGDPMSASLEWAREFENFDNRRLRQDDVDGCLVSTVFLGLDHGWGGGPPILFETMAFSSAPRTVSMFGREREVHEELDARRYATYDEAMRGHAEVLANVRATVAKIKLLKGAPDA